MVKSSFVIPADAGIQSGAKTVANWIPASAGMTRFGVASLERLVAMTSTEDCRVALLTALARLLGMTMPDSWKVTLRIRNQRPRHWNYAHFSKGHTFAKAGWRSAPSFEAK